MASVSSTPTGRRMMANGAPNMAKAWGAFNEAVFEEETELPRKFKELLAVAVALTTQCEGCLKGHSAAAVKFGATEAELSETVHVAAALRAGGAMYHGRTITMAELSNAEHNH